LGKDKRKTLEKKMRVIKTASYKKLSNLKKNKEAQGVGEVYTPEAEDEYADEQAAIDMKRRRNVPDYTQRGKGRKSLKKRFLQDSADAKFEDILRRQVNDALEEKSLEKRRKLLQLKSDKKTKEAQLREGGIQELFNISLKSSKNENEAAEATLSLITGGAFDAVEGNSRQEIIQKLLGKYGTPSKALPDTPMGLEDDNPVEGDY
jgi:hypothetical protein